MAGRKSDMAFKGILIGLSLFFGLGFLEIGMVSGVFLVLVIDAVLIIIRAAATGRSKEMAKTIKDFGEGMSEVGGAFVETAAKTTRNIVTAGGKALYEEGKELYKDIGGREGLKRSAEILGRIAEEAAMFGITVVAEGTKAVAHVTRETLENFNRKRENKRLSVAKREAIEDISENVEFRVIGEDE
ncbi:hypothetical protein FACS189496_1090 [Bacilli bacterium]|nr:hypothetical protein FACS189496_1090 [Bacilli bacterium]